MSFLEASLREYYLNCYWIKADQDPDWQAIVKDPRDLWTASMEKLVDDVRPERFGEYILTSSDIAEDFSGRKVFIPEPQKSDHGIYAEMAKTATDHLSENYEFPGIDYWLWLQKNPDKAPTALSREKDYLFFGGLLRGPDGYWGLPVYSFKAERSDITFLTQTSHSGMEYFLIEKKNH